MQNRITLSIISWIILDRLIIIDELMIWRKNRTILQGSNNSISLTVKPQNPFEYSLKDEIIYAFPWIWIFLKSNHCSFPHASPSNVYSSVSLIAKRQHDEQQPNLIFFMNCTQDENGGRGWEQSFDKKGLALLLPGICQGRGRTNFSIFFSSKNCVFYQMENRRSEGLKNNNTCYLNLGIYFRQDSFILHSCLYFKPGGHKFQLFQTFKHFKGFASSSSMVQVNLPQLLFPMGSICCCSCWAFWMTEWIGAESVEVFIRS